jgi:CrcB protein
MPVDGMQDPAARHEPLPVDPDVLASERLAGRHGLGSQLAEVLGSRADVLAAIALGGAAGAALRYGVAQLLPRDPEGFPWATFLVNVTGCLAIGTLMVAIAAWWPRSRYVRPLLGVGVLGGFTTFSTYALESRDLVAAGAAPTSLLYVVATLGAGLLAVVAGMAVGEALVRRPRPTQKAAP